MEQLQKRLAEVKAILAQAALTEGKSLANIDDWNDYHDEQDEIEGEITQAVINHNCKMFEQNGFAVIN